MKQASQRLPRFDHALVIPGRASCLTPLPPPRYLAGTALATCGEDGHVKVWSRQGMLRSTLATMPAAVFSIAWGTDNNHVLLACGKDLAIVPLQGGPTL